MPRLGYDILKLYTNYFVILVNILVKWWNIWFCFTLGSLVGSPSIFLYFMLFLFCGICNHGKSFSLFMSIPKHEIRITAFPIIKLYFIHILVFPDHYFRFIFLHYILINHSFLFTFTLMFLFLNRHLELYFSVGLYSLYPLVHSFSAFSSTIFLFFAFMLSLLSLLF